MPRTDNREDIVKALGGGKDAEDLIARYERFKMGATAANPSKFVAEREHLQQLLPDSEVDRIRSLFAEPNFEVYVTGSATQAGKKLSGKIPDVDCVVVVPANTSPELMAAIEARARNAAIRPDPAFLQANGLPANHTLGLDVKVMTPDQFFGFATTVPKPGMGTPLNYTRIDGKGGDLAAAKAKVPVAHPTDPVHDSAGGGKKAPPEPPPGGGGGGDPPRTPKDWTGDYNPRSRSSSQLKRDASSEHYAGEQDVEATARAKAAQDQIKSKLPELNPCFIAGTLVETPSGLRAIEALRVDDMVLGADPIQPTHKNRTGFSKRIEDRRTISTVSALQERPSQQPTTTRSSSKEKDGSLRGVSRLDNC